MKPPLVLILGAGVMVILALGLWQFPSAPAIIALKVLLAFTAMVATAAAVRTATTTAGHVRAAWLALAVGLGAFALGMSMRAWMALSGRNTGFLPGADMVRVVLPAGACAALLLLPTTVLGAMSRLRFLLDGVVVASSLVLMVWAGALDDIHRGRIAGSMPITATMAYPMVDAVTVTVALLVYLAAQPDQRLTVGLVALASLVLGVTNDAIVYLFAAQKSSPVPAIMVGWLAALLLYIAAAVSGRARTYGHAVKAKQPARAAVFLPFVPVAAAAVVMMFTEVSNEVLRGPLMVAGGLLIVAFLARQLIVVGENRRLFAAIARQALRDPLTGLANRAVFHDRVSHAMQLRQRDGVSVAVMGLDIDEFKMINETFGHRAGDELLNLVGLRILTVVRTGDTVARVGGDEFAVLIQGRDDHSHVIAHRVAESFDLPYAVDGHELMVRASVGLAVADSDDPHVSAEELLKRSDIALDAAKTSRVAGVHTFTAEMEADFFATGIVPPAPQSDATGARGSAVRLLGELRRAIDQGQLTLVYQPKLDLRTRNIVAAEALVRWPHPERGMLSPDEFMPLVRRHGLMGAVTDHVVSRALDDTRIWHDAGFAIPVAVNVSAPSLGTTRLATTVSDALRERGLAASALIVEITEDVVLEGLEQASRVLRDLRAKGVKIAVDDFGSGYSALSYLRDLPIDHVKLDRRFVAPITSDPRAAAVVRAVVNLAHELGLATVAEGIEDVETLEQLRDYGCDFGQGYYFSPPVAFERLLAMLANPPWAPA
ncbi:putative bifunctional diguanylate cyclase/phosphodiesterase [Mycolicibacterium rhodesiae]|nr:bifunctional diguanylate cyclase/phosphodiesterase [Mycolicibacterium rhodesiae]MCV7348342.1 bifunctional diguanylate cyclase/phosphodiesterase [Mycolicibacterium rhodesiae]